MVRKRFIDCTIPLNLIDPVFNFEFCTEFNRSNSKFMLIRDKPLVDLVLHCQSQIIVTFIVNFIL